MAFLSTLFGEPPTPPNPVVTANAQTASNIGTGIASNYLNAQNQVTPSGNLTYNINPYGYTYQDPLGGTYNIPQTTVTQSYTPTGQATLEAQQRTGLNLANMGEQQSNKLAQLLGSSFQDTFNQAPGSAPMDWLHNTAYATGDIADVGGLTRDYGPADNFSEDRKRVEAALFERMNPQLQQDRARLNQQLADQGIRYGSKAYDDAIAMADRQSTDARLAVTAKGGEEQQRLNDMAAQRATFQNAAQRDAFTQAASRSQFQNAATAQNLARNTSIYNAQNQSRDKWLQEQYALRSQPINEITALQSGSQVQAPNFISGANNQIANTDVAGIINANFGQSLDIYKQNASNVNNIIGGLFGVAGNAAKGYAASDRRVKKNVAKLGNVYMADRHDTPKKLSVYAYEYKDGHEDGGAARHIGPMAQDVERIDPDAVKTFGGVKHIHKKRVMGDILRVA